MSTTKTTENEYSAAEGRLLDALTAIINNASSPEIVEAQLILLRRLALQGDVIDSRIPAPLNITQIGGYLNLLETLKQPEMQAQMLAGILGVAGPNPPLGWFSSKPKLIMVPLANDRPEGDAQPSIPVNFFVRIDFVDGIAKALKSLHEKDCMLPILWAFRPLPEPMPGVEMSYDPLVYIGRTLDIVPATALRDPLTDAIALARPQGTNEDFQVVARALKDESAAPAANWEAFKCDETTCNVVPTPNMKYVAVLPLLANAGFYPASPMTKPESKSASAWAHFTNITGLVAGVTKLGDELMLMHSTAEISRSVFASHLNWVWNGKEFVASP